MAENVVINDTTYNGVDTLALIRADGSVATFYPDAVRYNAQDLTEDQKAQARQNLGVGSIDEVAEEVLARLKTPVFGRVDADNNIILTGELAEGTYTIKYEDAEGNQTEIGTLDNIEEPEIINQIPLSINADGTQFVGANGEDGYKTGTRLNSSGAESTSNATNYSVTGFIPVKYGDVVFFKNIALIPGATDNGAYIWTYKSDFTKNGSAGAQGSNLVNYFAFKPVTTYEDTGYIKSVTMADSTLEYAYLRISANGLNADSIITVNQPIE